MRHIDIETCEYMGERWKELIRAGYETAVRTDDNIAVMWKGAAARDHVRNVMQCQQFQGRETTYYNPRPTAWAPRGWHDANSRWWHD